MGPADISFPEISLRIDTLRRSPVFHPSFASLHAYQQFPLPPLGDTIENRSLPQQFTTCKPLPYITLRQLLTLPTYIAGRTKDTKSEIFPKACPRNEEDPVIGR